jgi:hypothetical protein
MLDFHIRLLDGVPDVPCCFFPKSVKLSRYQDLHLAPFPPSIIRVVVYVGNATLHTRVSIYRYYRNALEGQSPKGKNIVLSMRTGEIVIYKKDFRYIGIMKQIMTGM